MRYAIYWVPAALGTEGPVASQLRELGERQLSQHPVARRYGLHATLKAPFQLAAGRSVTELANAVSALAAEHKPITIPGLRLASIGNFWALVPSTTPRELELLAAAAVQQLDPFRAAPSEDELARRRPQKLSPNQRELLHAWGYPYVLDEFRFHLTLTDEVSDGLDRVGVELETSLSEILGRSIPLAAFALCVQPTAEEPFSVHSLYPFRVTQENR